MPWTTPADLRAQLEKLWQRGDILAAIASAEPLFPRRLTLKAPTSAQMTERFDEVRAWIAALHAAPHYRVESREFRHRVFGANAVPAEAWVDSLDAALTLLGKRREAARYAALLELTRREQPALTAWLAAHQLRALDLADEWPRLLAIVAWVAAHPRPAVYLRQVDIPGVHSKYLEARRGLLTELLDLALPSEAVDGSTTGINQFARRYGFLDKPPRIRLRLLDADLLPGLPGRDLTLDAAAFAQLDPGAARIFITENEINFLAFPPHPMSLVIFGAGYGFDTLSRAAWLHRCPIHYWGDIDTHGFAILDQLRSHFPHAASFLMDRATLMDSPDQWGEETHPTRRDLPRLSAEESALYDELRDNRLRANLRLEQERIGFGRVEAALRELG